MSPSGVTLATVQTIVHHHHRECVARARERERATVTIRFFNALPPVLLDHIKYKTSSASLTNLKGCVGQRGRGGGGPSSFATARLKDFRPVCR